MPEYTNFRQRLDTVLRTLDTKQVQDFLIAENQWSEGTPADPDFAMWMMIVGSPTLSDLHQQARQWLISHGHETEANAVLGKGKPRTATGKSGAKNQPPKNDLPPFRGPKKPPSKRKDTR